MTNRFRGIVVLALTALLGVLGAAAFLTSPAVRPAHLGVGDVDHAGLATGVSFRKDLEPVPILDRQPPASPQGSTEFAKIAEDDKENSDGENEGTPSATWAALPRPSESSRLQAAPGSRGPRAFLPGRLFLLCGHLIC